MVPHPSMIHVVSDLYRKDLLATVEREHQADKAGEALLLPHPAIRAIAFVAAVIGLRF